MAITHIVLLAFVPTASAQSLASVAERFLALKTKCKKPDGSTYIKSLVGGKQTSPEGKGKGLQYGFVVEFETEEDRTYYLEADPDHLAFAGSNKGVANDVCVFDFTPGEF
ncbi:hypothetical protein CALVIDRAFT_541416 [Calocera viscosa TUFC12733]|uniref:Stress-response A/B barrel domain-containing protein n=1 Tax=Calocera viscosa (strain TUFC12733) TaxID=1330018 RepID=A0A167HS91_CALVF|nr:hypothetical protein CALVIDRAFT_541416 [Calocera viscosa TUFC12733]